PVRAVAKGEIDDALSAVSERLEDAVARVPRDVARLEPPAWWRKGSGDHGSLGRAGARKEALAELLERHRRADEGFEGRRLADHGTTGTGCRPSVGPRRLRARALGRDHTARRLVSPFPARNPSPTILRVGTRGGSFRNFFGARNPCGRSSPSVARFSRARSKRRSIGSPLSGSSALIARPSRSPSRSRRSPPSAGELFANARKIEESRSSVFTGFSSLPRGFTSRPPTRTFAATPRA